MDWSPVIGVVTALVGAVLGYGFAVRRERASERRALVSEYLLSAYRRIAGAAGQQPLRREAATGLEDALTEVVLLGSLEEVEAARAIMASMAATKNAKLDDLLLLLRNRLREDFKLAPAPLDTVPVLRLDTNH